MKKIVQIVAATAVLATASIAADYVLKFSHVVSPNTPKGKAADFLLRD